MLICFAHGKESGPGGLKIARLTAVAERLGHKTLAPDFTDSVDPLVRLEKLLALFADRPPPGVLVGSSMGGAVVTAASPVLRPRGLFLMAPAVGMPGYEHVELRPASAMTVIVHGWKDDIVPVENVIRFAREGRAELHLLDDGHTLSGKIDAIESLFERFLLHLGSPSSDD